VTGFNTFSLCGFFLYGQQAVTVHLLKSKIHYKYKWVSEWVNSEIFQLYHGENNFNKLIFNGMMMRSALFYSKPTHCVGFL
jgi:hypothetical protein